MEDVSHEPCYRDYFASSLRRRIFEDLKGANGKLAGWVAQKALVGELNVAWITMLASYDRKSKWSMKECLIEADILDCPKDKMRQMSFPEALKKHLVQEGYITFDQAEDLEGGVTLPADFQGDWWPTGIPNAQCPKLPSERIESALFIDERKYSLLESALCTLVAYTERANHSFGRALRARFDCVGMGVSWTEDDVMYLTDLDGEKLLVIATAGTTNERDDGGDIYPDDTSLSVGAWVKCADTP